LTVFRNRRLKARLAGAFLWVFAASRLFAHHSAAAEFDTSKPVVLKGKVTRLDWANPHVHFWVDAVQANGVVTKVSINWELECLAPNYLQRLGWYKNTLKVGDGVTVRAYQAKDQPHLAKTDAVTLPGGRTVTTGRVDDASH
jgi:hypothetical protein